MAKEAAKRGKKAPVRAKPENTAGTSSTKTPNATQTSSETLKGQQQMLNIFSHTFSSVLSSTTFTSTLRSVKQALFDRDFARAFGSNEYLSVYAARYSPTRALCYASVLGAIQRHVDAMFLTSVETPPTLNMLSIGGGAAEVAAFGAFLSQLPVAPPGSVTLVDSAAWGGVVESLAAALTTPPPLSQYASAAARAANRPMAQPGLFSATFVQQDALDLDESTLKPLITGPLLVTILFTLNELFTSSGLGKTTRFLLAVTAAVPIGSLVLVVDSPGSYSATSIGKEAKRYPMQWLLDRIMQGTQAEPVSGKRWVKVESHDSLWFRLADKLDYPIPLENMRYQMHLYRSEAATD